MEDSEDESFQSTPPEAKEKAAEFMKNKLVPTRSKERYAKNFEEFETFLVERFNTQHISENMLVLYIEYLLNEKSLMISSVKTILSSIKGVLIARGKEINYNRIYKIIKDEEKTYEAKKSKVFTREEINKWLKETPNDSRTIVKKLVAQFSIFGALRRSEVVAIKLNDCNIYEDNAVIHVYSHKQNISRKFVLPSSLDPDIDPLNLLKIWVKMRESKKNPRLFLSTNSKGIITENPIGINIVGSFPSEIARFMGLPEPEKYTGHCWRRTAATWAVDEGADLLSLKRIGDWKGTKASEGYIDGSINERKRLASLISGESPNISKRSKTDPPTTINISLNNCKIESLTINKDDIN